MSWWDRQLRKYFGAPVNISSPSDGDMAVYDASDGEWKATSQRSAEYHTLGAIESIVGTDWDSNIYTHKFHNLETNSAYGDTVWIKGGANSSASYTFVVQDLSGNNELLIRGDGLTTFGNDVNVPGEAYSTSWSGSTEVPTKDAIHDEIGGWSNYSSCTFSANGTTWTPGTAPYCRYKQIGKTVIFQIETGSGNVGASTGYLKIGNLPVAPNSNYSDRVVVSFVYILSTGSTPRQIGQVVLDNSPAEFQIYKPDISNFVTADHPYTLHFTAIYEAA